MHRIGVQLCGRIDNKLIILINISETEREVGFYRHDQWGLLALLTIHGSSQWSSSSRVTHRLGDTVTGTIINKRGATLNLNAQSHDKVVHDVNGAGLWYI